MPDRTPKKTVTLFLVLTMAGIVAGLLWIGGTDLMNEIRVPHPQGDGCISGTVFKGSQETPLDGTLRICCIGKDATLKKAQQTSIPVDPGVTIKWSSKKPPLRFEVWKADEILMEFKVDASSFTCIKGNEYLEKDPYITSSTRKSAADSH